MIIKIFEQLILSFITSVGFSIIMLVPKKLRILSGITGMGGWAVYWIGEQLQFGAIISTFFSSLAIGAISFYFARTRKTPVTVYNIPGIVALVPGATSYQMTYNLIVGNYDKAISLGIKVVAIAGAIAAGLIIFDLVIQIIQAKERKIALKKQRSLKSK